MMLIEYLAINTLFAMLSAVLIYIFLKLNFIDFKCSWQNLYMFLGSFGLFNGIVSTLWAQLIKVPNQFQLLKPVVILIVSVQVIRIVLKISWRETVTSFFIIMLAMGIGNFSTTIVFSLCFNIIATGDTTSRDPILYFYANISIFIIGLIVVVLAHYALKLGKIKNLKPASILLGIPILIMLVYNSINFLPEFNLMSYSIILMSSLLFAIFCIIVINKYKKSEELAEELKQQKFYNESLKDTLQKLRRIKHDQADHLSVLKFMIKNNNFDEADKYICEIQNNPDSNVDTAVYNIENVALYGIISAKMDKARNTGITFNLKTAGTINSIPSIRVSELCEILGIYLDNAIEAAEASSKKAINMSVIEYTDSVDFKISNSCDEKPIMSKLKKDGYSTRGGPDRGHGLAIVDRILKKYKHVTNVMTIDESIMQFNQQLIIKKTPE
jgi:two-component system sensor histidine kinase AgrC